jgi:hypothetical protein
MQLDHVVAGRRLQDAAQLRGPELEAAPLLLDIGVLILEGVHALLRVGNHQIAHPVGNWQRGQAGSHRAPQLADHAPVGNKE